MSLNIDLTGLAHKFSAKPTGDPHICAACDKPIVSADEEDPEVPLLLFRGTGPATQMLSLHWECATKRMKPATTATPTKGP